MKKTGRFSCMIAEKIAMELVAKTSSHACARRTLRNLFTPEILLMPLPQRFSFKGQYSLRYKIWRARRYKYLNVK